MDQYYKVLDVESTATKEEIKRAYRKMSKKYHPDLNPDDKNAEEKFKEVVEAYEILTGKQKPEEPRHNPFRGFNPFGGMMKGKTIIHQVTITLEEAFNGVQKQLTIQKQVLCGTCHGEGGMNPQACNQCDGQGATLRGNVLYMCNNCGGGGILFTSGCNTCRGRGTKREDKTFNVTLPKGILNNTKILKQGYGSDVKNGVSGDILLNIKVTPHPTLIVEGLNLRTHVEVPILDIFLGTDVNISTLDGDVKVNIPKLSDPNKTLRLRSKGFTTKNDIRGDLYVDVKPKFPKEITPQEESLINTLKNSPNFNT
jgi:molecular chaperone DnaJ